MPQTLRPSLPQKFMFAGKNIKAVAIAEQVAFSEPNVKGNMQIMIPYKICAGQKATAYALPDAATILARPELAHLQGARPDQTVSIPEGYVVTAIKHLSEASAPKTLEALRNSGWKGRSFKDLWAFTQKHPGITSEGLGSCEANLTISIKELDQNDEWRMKDGKFNPYMEVDWINSTAGFAFKAEASASSVQALDRKFAALFGGTSSAQVTGGAPQEAVDEDVPF